MSVMCPPGVGGDHGAAVRRHQHHLDKKLKVVRLSELLSVVRLPPNAEACPMVSPSAVEFSQILHIFSAVCLTWFVQKRKRLILKSINIYKNCSIGL